MSREKIGELIEKNGELWVSYVKLKTEWFNPSLMFRGKKRELLSIAIDEASIKIGLSYAALISEIDETTSALEFWNKY